MSDAIKNPKGGLVLKVANFDSWKIQFNYFFYVLEFEIRIYDFELNEFISGRLKKDSKFNLPNYINITEFIEKFLLHFYYKYKENPKDYNKLIEIDQRINVEMLPKEKLRRGYGDLYKIPNFDELKKIWVRYIKFPKITDLNLNNFFIDMEKYQNNLEECLLKRDIILSFLNPYYSYPMKEIPIEEKDNIDLKHGSLNKMSGNAIKNPNGGLVLKVVNFDEYGSSINQILKYPILN